MIGYTITKNMINLVVNGKAISVPRDAASADAILAELDKGAAADPDRVLALADLRQGVAVYTKDNVRCMSDGTVEYKGKRMPSVIAEKVLACMQDSVPFQHVLRFFDRLQENPSQRAVEELYSFLEHKNMPITPEGKFLAYKGVRPDYWSITGNLTTEVITGKTSDKGHILNNVGAFIRVRRNHVNDDARVGCSSGLHAGSLAYAQDFGRRVVIVEIDPADVVSVPYDCSCQKLRTAAYKVVGDFEEVLTNSGVDRSYMAYGGVATYEDPTADDIDVDITCDEDC